MHLRDRSTIASAALFLFTVVATACAPDGVMAPRSLGAAGSTAGGDERIAAISRAANAGHNDVELGSCDRLRAPQGSTVAFHAYARGVQVYRWNGTAWTFVAPEATLSASANGAGVIGTHYAGPTWESNSGSVVKGVVFDRCTPDATAIPWLSLTATPSDSAGVFGRVAFIQRVNTVGGLVPVTPGTAIGDTARVPYTAEYWFHRAP